MYSPRSLRSAALAFATAGIWAAAGMPGNALAQAVIAPGTIDLLATPPELTASVEPNIVVTFDDSGSMASRYMGDGRPFDNGGWGAPWGCAGVIDPRAPAGDIRAHAMNGVYYNPNVLYTPPVKADGTSFPDADASLAAVWIDGISVNRPRNAIAPGTPGDYNNPDSNSSGDDGRRTNIIGIKSGSTDKRWTCGFGSYPGSFVGGENVNSGGPYYYRLKSSAPAIPLDAYGDPTSAGRSVIYNASNWEAVRLPNTTITIEGVPVNQWQNFANWYAYYRTRNLMTRTALSRTFAKFGGNVRVAWQNINDGTYKLPGTAIITKLLDKAGVACGGTNPASTFATGAQPDCYRSAFFNWVFETGANGSTPDRASTIRAGDFFKRGNTGNLLDPYWQLADASTGATGRELSCRQNFHMLVTDGYWNEGDPSLPSPYYDSETSRTLPDGTTFSNGDATSRVYWDVDGNKYQSSLANIAFNYWAQDLRTNLDDKVKPFIPDKTTGITGSTPVGPDPLANAEVYFNPANDPATWQHVVQFMVTLGIAGNLNYSDDVDCADPNSDMCNLRKGLPNSAGITGWPRPSNNAPPAIDDTWHAAVNSRGSYFSASNPGDLVTHLEAIINNVLARGASSTPTSISLPLATAGNSAYAAGYDSSDWSGSLIHGDADPNTQNLVNPDWDAGCKLTGGTFEPTTARCTQPSGGPWTSPPGYPSTARDPDSRRIFTSKRTVSGTVGIPFRWNTSTLGTEYVDALNQKPTDATLCKASTNAAACDAYGTNRVDYVRGYRKNEATPTPHFRTRSSVFGAVVNAAPLYVSSPRGGFYDTFPIGSPEQVAFAADPNQGYAKFQESHRSRRPMVYVGSNDGMLHAFDAESGDESWAFVPSTLIQNRRLARSTADTAGLTPGVDSAPREADVFLNGSWHTILVGSLRLGGRGIYALDVTDVPSDAFSESTVANAVMWEFNSGPTRDPASVPSNDPVCAPGATTCPSLGYTYDAANVARIHAGNKWVAVVSSGYFPSRSSDAAIANDASEPAAKHTSLLVIDLATGALIREIRTDIAPQTRPSGFKTYGLSTPTVFDVGNDQIADFVYAGDLAGNLWRFDISDANPTSWKADLMFSTYAAGGAAAVGDQPIVYNPTALRDPVTMRPILVFGTGKYLGRDDRTSGIPGQAFYGIRDYATYSAAIAPNTLVTQVLTQSPTGMRSITGEQPPSSVPAGAPEMLVGGLDAQNNPIDVSIGPANGWRLPLNFAGTPEKGERADRRAIPYYSANLAVLYTMIPKGDDPCDPGRRFAVMAINGANGAAAFPGSPGHRAGVGVTGQVTGSDRPIGDPVEKPGGGLIIPGASVDVTDAINKAISPAPWHRAAWKELIDLH
ncbi:MAG TPA: PilC/PilY family type IV pilus protein [Dokdonella sp.]|nr:PilC/PilY family type IV pilus protein [Dokdonella sp.]